MERALPELQSKQVLLGLIVIAVLLAGNLRGVRQAGQLFAAPTYLFLLAMGILVIGGLVQAAGRGFATVPPPHISVTAVLGPLLILRHERWRGDMRGAQPVTIKGYQ
jgi:amino acid transporter